MRRSVRRRSALPPEMVVGIIAGGHDALTRAIEGAEDLPDAAVADSEGSQLLRT